MSGSRKSLQRAAQTFNPRAENWWSKDDSKFGQRMLEKMGWKKGEGIGREGQGVTENIKIRWKLDSKGLGFSIKEDEWVAVEHDFSKLLSNLSKDSSRKSTKKLSLELTSSSSRSRVHYRKFIRGKDISKYSKKDLSGILGRNAEVSDEDDCKTENHIDDGSAERVKFSFEDVFNNSSKIDDSSSKKLKKRKFNSPDPLHVSDDDFENCGINSEYLNDTENNSVSSVEVGISLDIDVSSSTNKVKKRRLNSESRNNAENGYAEPDSSELTNFISSQMENSSSKKKVKKEKVKRDSNLNQTLLVNEDEQNQNSECDLEIDNSVSTKKCKNKSVIDSSLELAMNGCEEENQSTVKLENSLIPEQCSSARKRRKEKTGSNIDDFDRFMQKVTEFNASTDPKAVIEEFEKNKEALLKRYRDSYLRNYLESANENDSRIYWDLNGDELDCENGANSDSSKKMKKSAHLRARPLTKAERIVLKARLLKTIQNKSSHKFAGSNLNDIVGYGNVIVSS